ncbi:hypothetical protein FM107_04600 [Sphingobacterium sp. JB170]|nr:hypothetical protein FM107_04600 [Sphingobacterium sp. JB170]
MSAFTLIVSGNLSRLNNAFMPTAGYKLLGVAFETQSTFLC